MADLMPIWRNPSTGEIYYPASYVDRLREALERIANPTREGAWETRPVSYDFVRLAREALGSSDSASEVRK